jgi:DNA-binding HxlR family transcriptional regulator
MGADDMNVERRSGCPINLTLEILGDKWSLLILRDMLFFGKRHFRELLQSEEGISSNILADRLKRMVDEGLLTRGPDPTHRQKVIYSLTEKSIALVPMLAQIAIWGRHHTPVGEGPDRKARQLEEGGPALWEQLMDDLRAAHLDTRSRTDVPAAGG